MCVIDCDILLISLFLFSDHGFIWLRLSEFVKLSRNTAPQGSLLYLICEAWERKDGWASLHHRAKDIYGSRVRQEPGNSKFHGGYDRRVSSEISWSDPPFPHDSLLSVYEAGTLLYYSQSQLQGNPKFFNTNVKNFTPKNGTA